MKPVGYKEILSSRVNLKKKRDSLDPEIDNERKETQKRVNILEEGKYTYTIQDIKIQSDIKGKKLYTMFFEKKGDIQDITRKNRIDSISFLLKVDIHEGGGDITRRLGSYYLMKFIIECYENLYKGYINDDYLVLLRANIERESLKVNDVNNIISYIKSSLSFDEIRSIVDRVFSHKKKYGTIFEKITLLFLEKVENIDQLDSFKDWEEVQDFLKGNTKINQLVLDKRNEFLKI